MNRANSGGGQHRDHRFGDHRHIDDHAVSITKPLGLHSASKLRDFFGQFSIGETLFCIGHGAVIDQRQLIPASFIDMAVKGVITRV